MAEYLIQDTTLTAIADAIRSKTGKTDAIPVPDMPTEIASITAESGGSSGSSEDFCYVTFMSYDGTVEYGKKAVAVGDDCADPIARGLFETPTRESTVQYDYTFYGWAAEANGAADSGWSKSITEDKTVYANFAAAVRYYTITYYDGDTVLKTESVAYGATPNYSPEKSGYNFEGWEPALTTVTGDASYYSQWSTAITFANGAWEDIVNICNSGNAEDNFSRGNSRNITLTLDDGTSYDASFTIIAFNHDDKEDGTKANITVISNYAFNPDLFGLSSYALENGWKDSNARSSLNSTFINWLPENVRAAIKPVVRLYATKDLTTMESTVDSLWVPSFAEYGATSLASEIAQTQGEVYEWLDSKGPRMAKGFYASGPSGAWVSHASRTIFNTGNLGCVYNDGSLVTSTMFYPVRVCFCI